MIYLNLDEPDVFTETLSKLKAHLTRKDDAALPSHSSPLSSLSIEALYMHLRQDVAVQRSIEHVIRGDCNARLTHLRNERQRRRVLSEQRLDHLRGRREQGQLHGQQAQHAVTVQQATLDRHVVELATNSSRRLQVLLFECLGEIQKAVARAQARVAAQEAAVDSMLASCELNHAWAILTKRCEEELHVAAITDIPPTRLAREVAAHAPNEAFQMWAAVVEPFLAKKIPTTTEGHVMRVTRLLTLQGKPSTATANKTKCVRAPPNDDDDASTPSMMTRQFQTLRHLLADFSPAPKTMARRTARCKTFPDDHTISALTPLSSSTIRWLPKPPHGYTFHFVIVIPELHLDHCMCP
ncbi:Aste57867_3655 [Aphanomyces stellatus]|uniref:Aste57867_3655 protein n=1 Tax=Aphanomyces stellatus TaxID=120398 RepID=A0A485KDZ5_9STRA|nr:hypothetical protein As57867_003644 [Aphanomyces stellatus]VFT80810.1 Aste57867_3655 [Aphanomyces stellatus]